MRRVREEGQQRIHDEGAVTGHLGLSHTADLPRNCAEHAPGLSHRRAGRVGCSSTNCILPRECVPKAINFPIHPSCHQVRAKLPRPENTLRQKNAERFGLYGNCMQITSRWVRSQVQWDRNRSSTAYRVANP